MREPVKQLLTQIGAKKGAAMKRAFPYFTFCIIMSSRKPCHMPFRKLIPPFTLTATRHVSRERAALDSIALRKHDTAIIPDLCEKKIPSLTYMLQLCH